MSRKKKITRKKMTIRRAALLVTAGACVLAIALVLMSLETPPAPRSGRESPESASSPAPTPENTAPESASMPTPPAAPPMVPPTMEATPAAPPPSLPAPGAEDPTPGHAPAPVPMEPAVEADFKYLRAKELLIPVEGVKAGQLRDSYYDGRSEGRTHEALDIMAAQNTPVLATADGTVAKLFQSDKGGITLYQLDQSGQYYFYYAHLSRYADGMQEGKPIKRGEVIGYVGDTGNAGAGNFHLHFGIQKPKAPGKWSGGFPINPYPLLTDK